MSAKPSTCNYGKLRQGENVIQPRYQRISDIFPINLPLRYPGAKWIATTFLDCVITDFLIDPAWTWRNYYHEVANLHKLSIWNGSYCKIYLNIIVRYPENRASHRETVIFSQAIMFQILNDAIEILSSYKSQVLLLKPSCSLGYQHSGQLSAQIDKWAMLHRIEMWNLYSTQTPQMDIYLK